MRRFLICMLKRKKSSSVYIFFILRWPNKMLGNDIIMLSIAFVSLFSLKK